MTPEGAAKHFILAFVLALAGYIVCYQLIEHRRTRHGPWQITFTAAPGDVPLLVINQPSLGITNVQLTFPETPQASTSVPTTLSFGQPKPVPYDLPFGKCVFMDTTFLPGTLTLQVFQHEIELLPRVLVVDRLEHRWQSSTRLALSRPPPSQATPAP
jgi:hypothetical protein